MHSANVGQPTPPRIVSFLLHAHLPYGLRVDQTTSLEQAWLCEAVTESYLPLLSMLQRLGGANARPWLTLSLSPTLLELWRHPEFTGRYEQHLAEGMRVIDREINNYKHSAERRQRANDLKRHWLSAADSFAAINGDLVQAFTQLAKRGVIELITTTATHAFLPALQNNPRLRHLQLDNGIQSFRQHTGIHPKGFWLPECGYYPELEIDLAKYGVSYFGLESIGLTAASPASNCRRPLQCENGLLALGRDAELSGRVWQARTGYPGHVNYREFHCDGIHDIAADACGPFVSIDGTRLPLGLKYWRVTGTKNKQWYDPQRAQAQVQDDAQDFVEALSQTEPGIIFLPFDAELFGHWWYEGPQWLEQVLRMTQQLPATQVACASDASQTDPNTSSGQPAASSWGHHMDYSFWINAETDWIYPQLQSASLALEKLHQQYVQSNPSNPLQYQALEQAGRELLLASASDWPFMIRANTTADYGRQRLQEHFERFQMLLRSLHNEKYDAKEIQQLRRSYPAFDKISFKAYAP